LRPQLVEEGGIGNKAVESRAEGIDISRRNEEAIAFIIY